ncbi:MAG: dimethylarginine dimethylaminohydrolase family protein, partial [Gaiellaceae bacterium]
MTAPLRRVLVRPPRSEDAALWQAYGWRFEPDPGAMAEEHEAFRALLGADGAEVLLAETPHGPDPDAIYAYDPALVVDAGAILLRPGKEGRRGEPDAMAADLVEAGVPIAGRLEAPGLAEGGDTVWLDEGTLLVGRGYRTNDEGIRALSELLPDVEVVWFDLPHYHGAGEVMHLMSFLSPLDADLAVVYLPLMPVRLVELLRERGIEFVEVPDEEFESIGPNVLALGPRVALALAGSDETRRRMERAGV